MKWKALAAVIGVFLIGLVSGALLGRSYLNPYKSKGKYERGHVRALSRELNLSEEQKQGIGPVLNEARRKLYQLKLESYEKAETIIGQLQDKIRPSLRPEQIAKLDELTRQFHEQRKRRKARIQREIKSLDSPAPSP